MQNSDLTRVSLMRGHLREIAKDEALTEQERHALSRAASWLGDVVEPSLTPLEQNEWEAAIENECHLLVSTLDPDEDPVAYNSTIEDKREAIAIWREQMRSRY